MKVAFLLLTIVGISFNTPKETNYRQVFGRDYIWAVDWLQGHDRMISEFSSEFNISSKELKAIVFPELIRYNGLFNVIEIESLKYLYVSEGKYYADFSVGYFQMKPSFAEMVEEDGSKLLNASLFKKCGWNDNFMSDTEEARRERVKRLGNTRQQLFYLCVFYKICESRFKHVAFSSPVERLKFFATCYNAGYRRSYDSLKGFQLKNNFFRYNYASVSAYYFGEKMR